MTASTFDTGSTNTAHAPDMCVMSDFDIARPYEAGDQVGAVSRAASSVRLATLDPSAFMM